MKRSLVTTCGLVCSAMVLLPGCGAPKRGLTPPAVTTSPYSAVAGDVLFAVAPVRNESGTSALDAELVADELAGAAARVEGIGVVPLDRTLLAMHAMGLEQITTQSEAIALAQALGADGILVGTVTAYDPYSPPVLGLSVALFTRPGLLDGGFRAGVDPRSLSMLATDAGTTAAFGGFGADPATVASSYFDGRDHGTQWRVKRYAEGRSDPGSALGWKVYLHSADLFVRFGAQETVRDLLADEWMRVARLSHGLSHAGAE